jgi:hypothetical protein
MMNRNSNFNSTEINFSFFMAKILPRDVTHNGRTENEEPADTERAGVRCGSSNFFDALRLKTVRIDNGHLKGSLLLQESRQSF